MDNWLISTVFYRIIKADYLLEYLFTQGKLSKEKKLETLNFLRNNTFQAANNNQ